MKKIILILILVSLGWSLSAQKDTLSWKQTLKRHDIQIGIGDPILPAIATGHIKSHLDYYYEPTASDWFSPDAYRCVFWTPNISVGYKYRFAKWFWFGATISYTGLYDVYYDRITNKKISSESDHIITIMPSVRFSWLNKEIVTLYSGLSVGYAIDIYHSNAPDQRFTLYEQGALAQFTAVGVHVGRKWYGFAEIGFGIQGIFQAGFGYNFNSKKK